MKIKKTDLDHRIRRLNKTIEHLKSGNRSLRQEVDKKNQVILRIHRKLEVSERALFIMDRRLKLIQRSFGFRLGSYIVYPFYLVKELLLFLFTAKKRTITLSRRLDSLDLEQFEKDNIILSENQLAASSLIESDEVVKQLTSNHNPNLFYYKDYEKKLPLEKKLIKAIAFYLPQFHEIDENNEWWENGFTEWTNVTRGVPRFEGHFQPRLPADTGFYNLTTLETLKKQVELALNYGVYGFCFYYYWFSGKRLLEKPLDLFLESEIEFPFCLCWANENWTRRWDGQEDDVLIRQEYKENDPKIFAQDISRYLADKRYIKINGRPLIIVYRAQEIPKISSVLEEWKNEFAMRNIAEPIFYCAQTFGFEDPAEIGFDGAIEFPPHNSGEMPSLNSEMRFFEKSSRIQIKDYRDMVRRLRNDMDSKPYSLIRTVFPSWDNDARKKGDGLVFVNASPNNYADWLKLAIDYAEHNLIEDEAIIFINAWNEWGEGAHLEPDRHFGYAYLDATYEALSQSTLNQKQ